MRGIEKETESGTYHLEIVITLGTGGAEVGLPGGAAGPEVAVALHDDNRG